MEKCNIWVRKFVIKSTVTVAQLENAPFPVWKEIQMDTKNVKRRRRRNKSKGAKLQVCPENVNIKEKCNKTQLQAISRLQTNKIIPDIENQLVGQKRTCGNTKFIEITRQLKEERRKEEESSSQSATKSHQNLNNYQRSVIERSLKKNNNHIKTNTNDSNQSKKSNLNIHQLKVLEKLAQKKDEFKCNSQKRRNNESDSIGSLKSSDKISGAEKRLQMLKKQLSDRTQKEFQCTQNVRIGAPVSITRSPVSITRSPVSITNSPALITGSSMPVTSSGSPASITKYNLLKLKDNLKAREISTCVISTNYHETASTSLPTPKIYKVKNKEENNEYTPKRSNFATIKNNSAEKRLQKLRGRLSDSTQKEILCTQTLLGIGTPVSITRSPASTTRPPALITRSSAPVTLSGSPASITKYNLLQLKDDLKARGSQSVEKSLQDFKKRLSNANCREIRSSPGPGQESSNLQNIPTTMTVDNYACKRKSYETEYSFSKRTKVEPSAQLLNIDTENIHPNGCVDNINNSNLAILNNTTGNSSIHSSSVVSQRNTSFDEQMDWETVVEQIIQVREDSQHSCSNSNINLFNDKNIAKQVSGPSGIVFIVVDTNIFISHLSTVEKLTDKSKQVGSCKYHIMVPWVVLCELDKLKSYSKDSFSNTHMMARKAMRFLHENLSSNPKICGQSVKVANDHLFPCPLPDDQILNCCLQISGSGDTVILLTNDINLCNKAAVSGIKMFTHKQFIADYFDLLYNQPSSTSTNLINSKTTPKMDEYDNAKADNAKETLLQPTVMCLNRDKLKYLEMLLQNFLSVVLENEMKERFNKLWTKVVLVEPPWSLSDILKCLAKHWIAVFKEILPIEAQSVVANLQHFFPPREKATFNAISESNFKVISSLGMKLVECFQINSKYSISATECLREILKLFNDFNKQKTSSTDKNLISTSHIEESPSNNYQNSNYSLQKIIQETKSKEISSEVTDNQISTSSEHIIGILKIIWEGLCKFCTDLANALDVSHNLSNTNNKVTPLDDLVSQASSVGNQLQLIVNYTSRMITSFLEHVPLDQRQKEATSASEALTNILYDTICGMGHKSTLLDSKNVLEFCTLHRDLLEEAYNKFIVLHNLIMECSQKYAALQTK